MELQVGQSVRAGQFGPGNVTFIDGNRIGVRTNVDGRERTFCPSDIQIPPAPVSSPYEQAKRALLAKKADAVEMRLKLDKRMRTGIEPSCTMRAFADALLNSGDYTLRLSATEAGEETAQTEWIDWTGESFPDEFICINENRPQARQWRLTFRVQDGMQYPFPVIAMGSQEIRFARSTTPRGLYHNGKVEMDYAEVISQLAVLGLRGQ